MIINRQNYEEYFLLYADNELKPAERKRVEAFVAANEDLKSEFEFFQQMKLDPEDHTAFPEKAGLYKPIELQDDQYHPNPEELQLLMYLDNEMETEERLAFEQKLKTDKKLRAEFDILLNARLEPDFGVKFEDKASLYRYTEKPARLIRLTWMRVAVAASVLLIAGLLWMNNQNETPVENNSLAEVNSNKAAESTSIQSKEVKDSGLSKEDSIIPSSDKLATQQIAQSGTGKVKSDVQLPAEKKETPVKTVNRPGENKNKPEMNLPEQSQQEIAKAEAGRTNKNEPVAVQENLAVISVPVTEDSPTQPGVSYASATNIKSNYATDALMYAEPVSADTELEDEEKPRKGALRGLFRKANRVFNKVTNPDPNLPSVRIANLEFALAK